MKRWIVLFLCVAFVLAGCMQSETVPDTVPETVPVEEETENMGIDLVSDAVTKDDPEFAEQPQVEPDGTKEHEYTVQRGDSLRKIAAAYGVSIEAICNRNSILSPNNISVGQVLIIPEVGVEVPVPEALEKQKEQEKPPEKPPVKVTLTPTAPPKSIEEIIERAELPGNTKVVVSIYDFKTGRQFSHRGSVEIYPASVKKNLYMLAYLEEVKQGNKNLQDVHILQEEDKYTGPGSRVRGAGIIRDAEAGTSYTWAELLELMITISDNVATNLFIEDLGLETINAKAKQNGLKNTHIGGKLFMQPPANTYTTANDMNQILVALYSQKHIDGKLYDHAINLLKRVTNKDRIGKYPPKGTVIANKGGTVASVVGDSALVFYPDREPIALTIFIVGNNGAEITRSAGDKAIANLSKDIMEFYQKQ